MKIYIFILSAFMLSAPVQADDHQLIESTDTTWPLRLAGDATWPLRFRGGAQHQNDAKEAVIQVSSINRNPGRANLACRSTSRGLQKHKAGGTIVLNNQSYKIQGVCFVPQTNMMEFIAEDRTGKQTTMIAKIPQPYSPTLRGHLHLERKTYNVSVTCHDRVPDEATE